MPIFLCNNMYNSNCNKCGSLDFWAQKQYSLVLWEGKMSCSFLVRGVAWCVVCGVWCGAAIMSGSSVWIFFEPVVRLKPHKLWLKFEAWYYLLVKWMWKPFFWYKYLYMEKCCRLFTKGDLIPNKKKNLMWMYSVWIQDPFKQSQHMCVSFALTQVDLSG